MIATTRSLASVALLAVVVLLASACSPATGALGTPATPPATSNPSVEIPTADVTPDTASPTPTVQPTGSAAPSGGPTTAPTPTSAPDATIIVRAYFLVDEHLVPVLREIPRTQAVATAAMRQLLAGPNTREGTADPALVTTIPDGTQLLGLSITDGVATVDLSREYETGGGSASMFGRLSQVVYTLTQFSTVDGVQFELDGQPVTIFGGEGLILDHPVGRADYHDQLPAIFVDRPAWGAALGNPGKVTGLANMFEATFQVQLRDASGTLLYDQHQMATCGNGCWGTFSVEIGYTVLKAQWGTLRVLDYSAKDGSPENITDYPVWLTPAG